MSGSIGAGSHGEEPITAINITPLVDVSLVLVIIFMAVAPLAVVAGIKVMESQAHAATGKVSASDNVNVNLDSKNQITINGKLIAQKSLIPEINIALQKSKDKMVIVSAAATTHVGQMVEILDSARQAGALNLAILKNDTAHSNLREISDGNRNHG
jgi:biopolymer transport protein ExbD